MMYHPYPIVWLLLVLIAGCGDQKLRTTYIELVSPLDGAITTNVNPSFSYRVYSTTCITSCSLEMDAKLRGQPSRDVPAGTVTYEGIPAGTHHWAIVCQDAAGRVFRSQKSRVYTALAESLTACKRSGWKPATIYKISKSLVVSDEECFVIDQPGVVLDGDGKVLSSTKFRDVVYTRIDRNMIDPTDKSEPDTVLGDIGTAAGQRWGFAWRAKTTKNHNANHNVGDFDNDGDLDLFTTYFTFDAQNLAEGAVYQNQGKGSNDPLAMASSTPLVVTNGFALTASRPLDFDLDGKLDLFVSVDGGPESLFRGDGTTGGFSLGYGSRYSGYRHSVNLADFDGDGQPDYAMSGAASASLAPRPPWRVMLRRGALTGGADSFASSWSSGSVTGEAGERGDVPPQAIADFNGDGRWDLVIPNLPHPNHASPTPTSYVRLNSGDGTRFDLKLSVPGTVPAAVSDLEGDGDTDLLLFRAKIINHPVSKYPHSTNSAILVYLNDGKGQFTKAGEVEMPYNGTISIKAVDLNGDSKADIVSFPEFVDGKLTVFRNSGQGSFVKHWTGTVSGGVLGADLGDLDNDGDLDLFVSRVDWNGKTSTYSMGTLVNKGDGTFVESAMIKPDTHEASYMEAWSPSYNVNLVGDLTGKPATAVVINAREVTVRNFAAIRGFSVAVDVQGDNATVEDVTVESPEIYGVRVGDLNKITVVKGTRVKSLKMKNFFYGTAVGLLHAKGVILDNSSLCPPFVHQRLTPVSTYCVNGSDVTGKGNRVILDNGCGGSASNLQHTSCRFGGSDLK